MRVVTKAPLKHRAFTIIELVVVIGVVLLLLGLWLPAIAQATEASRKTRDLSAMRQTVAMLQVYENDYRCYPIHPPQVGSNMWEWMFAMERGSYVQSLKELDPRYDAAGDQYFGIVLSACLMYDPTWMHPGLTGLGGGLCTPIRERDVLYPSLKGALVRPTPRASNYINPPSFCCGSNPVYRSAVAFLDGSGAIGSARDFLPDGQLYTEGEYGIPVISTWGGAHGRDR